MTLKECLETLLSFDGVDVSTLNTKQMIEEGRKRLFDFDYQIFDTNYKGVLETHFIRNFFMREIGFETEGLFKFQLETWLMIHMPYFNKLFESELINFDPLVNSEMSSSYTKTKDTDGTVDSNKNEDATRTNKQTSNGTENRTGFNRDLESDTPDSRLTITTENGSGVIEYASNIGEHTSTNDVDSTNTVDGTNTDKSTTTGNTTTDITETESYIQSRTGKIGSTTYSKMMMEYRQSLVRVEQQMFNEMQQLFMLVY